MLVAAAWLLPVDRTIGPVQPDGGCTHAAPPLHPPALLEVVLVDAVDVVVLVDPLLEVVLVDVAGAPPPPAVPELVLVGDAPVPPPLELVDVLTGPFPAPPVVLEPCELAPAGPVGWFP
jgi:hypothetical protein